MNRNYLRLVLIGLAIVLTILTLGLYLYKFGSCALSGSRDDWGTFGDYIGGILGTILAALTIYLLYETFHTQNAQLRIQEDDSNINFINLQYNQIISDINDISFDGKKGSDAIHAWNTDDPRKQNNVVNTLNFIVHTVNTHVETIHSNRSTDKRMKEQFLSRAYLMLHSKLIWPVLDKMYDNPAFKGHTDNLYNNFNVLMKDTYAYLVPKRQLLKPTDTRILALFPQTYSWEN